MKNAMTLEEFTEYVCKGVKAGLPHELAEARVNIGYGKYWNSQIEIERPWSDTPARYLLTFDYREYLSEIRTPEFAIADILNSQDLYRVPIDFRHMDVSDFHSIRSRIVSRVVSSKPQYTHLLENRPVRYLKGTQMAVVWDFHTTDVCYTGEEMEEIVRKPVTWELMEAWGISVDELERIAEKNTPLLRPARIEYAGQMPLEDGTQENGRMCGKLVTVTNKGKIDGAIVAAYPGVKEKLTDMLGSDVYIIPCSIHKCFAIAKKDFNLQSFFRLICSTDKTGISAKDFLADDILEYTSGNCLITAGIHEAYTWKRADRNSISTF